MLVKKDKIDDWRQHIEKMANLATTSDMKSLWNELGKLAKPSKDKPLIQPIRNGIGDICYEPEEIIKAWTEHFKKLAADPTGHSRDNKHWAKKAFKLKYNRI